jgi:hypothetical protein
VQTKAFVRLLPSVADQWAKQLSGSIPGPPVSDVARESRRSNLLSSSYAGQLLRKKARSKTEQLNYRPNGGTARAVTDAGPSLSPLIRNPGSVHAQPVLASCASTPPRRLRRRRRRAEAEPAWPPACCPQSGGPPPARRCSTPPPPPRAPPSRPSRCAAAAGVAPSARPPPSRPRRRRRGSSLLRSRGSRRAPPPQLLPPVPSGPMSTASATSANSQGYAPSS